MLSNPVVISIVVLLALSLLRVNVVIALVISALTAGLCGDLGLSKTIEAFTGGLGGGAEVAMNYAMLGAFAIAISKSGITDLLAYKIITRMNKTPTGKNLAWFKYMLLGILLLFSISSQNLLPVHIAFIPIVVPPLLSIFNRLKNRSSCSGLYYYLWFNRNLYDLAGWLRENLYRKRFSQKYQSCWGSTRFTNQCW